MKVLSHFLLWSVGLAEPWTFYSEKSCQAISRYARGKKFLAEIGCWQGVNTARIRRSMAATGTLYAVDPYPAGFLGFSAAEVIAHWELKKIRKGKIKWMKMTDLQAARVLERKGILLDFIFSDSHNDYEGFRKTWEAWSELAAPGCVYILANSTPKSSANGEEPASAVFTRKVVLKDPRFHLLETVGKFTILERKRH